MKIRSANPSQRRFIL